MCSAFASATPVQGGPTFPFTLPPLPYAAHANVPHTGAQTMELHHGKHLAAYVAHFNERVTDYPSLAAMPPGTMLGRMGQLPEPIQAAARNTGGGHAHHSMFWLIMGQGRREPIGSGWTMVLADCSGKLPVGAKPSQHSPLMESKTVLFGNDVWEHAYYLKYQNCRPGYLAAWWTVVYWPAINDRCSAAKAGTLVI